MLRLDCVKCWIKRTLVLDEDVLEPPIREGQVFYRGMSLCIDCLIEIVQEEAGRGRRGEAQRVTENGNDAGQGGSERSEEDRSADEGESPER